MKKYNEITKYLDLYEKNNYFGKWIFDNEHAGTHEDPKVAPHLSYEPFIIEFIKSFYDNDFAVRGYRKAMEPVYNKLKKGKDICDLDENELLVYLTYIIRQDRFCDGYILGKCQDGTMYEILKELSKYDD